MLATEDVEELFASMRTAYGGQWKHSGAAVRVWRNALSKHSVEDLRRAANQSLHCYIDHPPTLPQFLQILRPPEQHANTYLPAPEMSPLKATANVRLLKAIGSVGGVDKDTLRRLLQVRDAVIEEHTENNAEFTAALRRELQPVAEKFDRKKRDAERHQAWLRFCRQRGIRMPARDLP